MVAMEVAAPKATEDPREGIASKNDKVAANQTIVEYHYLSVTVFCEAIHGKFFLESILPALIGL